MLPIQSSTRSIEEKRPIAAASHSQLGFRRVRGGWVEKLGRAGYSLRPNRRTSLKLCFLVFLMLVAAASSASRLSPSADLYP